MINELIKKHWVWILIILFLVLIIYLNYNINNLNSYDNKLNIKSKINIYLFYADWCPHCKHLMPEWNKFIKMVDSNKINIKMINDCEDSELCKKFNIDRFPIIIFENNDKYNIYNGNLKADDLKEYLLNM